MLCYSDLVVAFFEALASDPVTAASTGRFYLNTTSHVVKWYANSAWHTAMDLDTAQTATNKTFTSPVINSGEIDNSFVDGYLDFNEESAPSTPSSGKVRLYAKTDKKFWYKDSAGVEAQFGASGSGELNLIENPSDATNWSSTGWSSAAATTTTAGDLPLGGIVDTAIQITSDTSAGTEAAEYVSYAFTTPASLACKLKVEFWMRPGSNFIASEWTVSVYQSTTRQALSTDSSSVTYLPNAAGKFTTTFDCAASTAYTLRFARPVNAGANAGVLNVANVVVGPGIQPQGAAVGPWTNFTPTWTGITLGNGTTAGRWRRVGDSIEVDQSITFGTTTSASGTLRCPVPTGTSLAESTENKVIGEAMAYDASAPLYYAGTVSHNTSSEMSIVFGSATGSATSTIPFTWTTSDLLRVHYMVPISEWIGAGTLNVAQNDVEYAYNSSTSTTDDTASFGYGPTGALIKNFAPAGTAYVTKRVSFQRPRQDGDSVTLEFNDGNGWIPVETRLGAVSYNDAGTTAYGARLFWNSSTALDVLFYSQASVAATWAAINTWYWRVRKCSAGVAVGFGKASSTSLGLVKSAQPTIFTFDQFNPTDLAGTWTNASARTSNVTGNGDVSISTISSGTVTLTFGATGQYQVVVAGAHRHAASYTNTDLKCTYGGTATLYYALSTFNLGPLSNSGDTSGTDIVHVDATAGQTMTVKCEGRVTGSGVVGNHTFNCKVMAYAT